MKVKVGDTVRIIAGKDKGKEGKVIKTLKAKNKVVVEGLNIIKKHSKPTNTNDKGGIFDIEAPLHVSNVKVITDTKASKKAEKKETKEVKEVKTVKETAKKTTPKEKKETAPKARKTAPKAPKKASK